MILAIDVGGTNTRLAVLEVEAGGPRVIAAKTFASLSYASLEEIVDQFLGEYPGRVQSACIGVAGPSKDGHVTPTNLAWAVDAEDLARRFSIPYVEVINDVEANAWGIATLSPADFFALNDGAEAPKGTAAVVAAGTGLGLAALVWNGDEYLPIPSQGGHVDFAPRNPLEIDLFAYLRERLGKRVSYERVLSGPGLVNLYKFLRDCGRGEEPEWLASRLTSRNAPAEISAAADRCALANAAVELFVSIYGAAVGNAALYFWATAGIYLGGGIAPKMSARLKSRTFLDAYFDKGRLSPELAAMPVRIIMNDKAALMGAARCAWRRLSGQRGPMGRVAG